MRLKKTILPACVAAAVAVIVYSALYGRLVPYGPVIIGFEKLTYPNINLYYHHGRKPVSLEGVDGYLERLMKIQGLRLKRKVDVILCGSAGEKKRFLGSLTRAQTGLIFGRIFISKQLQDEAANGVRPFDVYLQHELSHALLHQNQTFKGMLNFPYWLDEGLAVYCSDQFGKAGYYTQSQVSDTIAKGYFFQPGWWAKPWDHETKESKTFPLKEKYLFVYSEFGCIVDDLIKNYGQDRFLDYYHRLLRGDDEKKVFESVYGKSFEDYLSDFKIRMTADGSSRR
jgi:hypothetical protein